MEASAAAMLALRRCDCEKGYYHRGPCWAGRGTRYDGVEALGRASAEAVAAPASVPGAPVERRRARALHPDDQRDGQRARLSQRALRDLGARAPGHDVAARSARQFA